MTQPPPPPPPPPPAASKRYRIHPYDASKSSKRRRSLVSPIHSCCEYWTVFIPGMRSAHVSPVNKTVHAFVLNLHLWPLEALLSPHVDVEESSHCVTVCAL